MGEGGEMSGALDIGFWIQLFVYGVSFGMFGGTVMTKLSHLEKKQDKHNNVLERLAKVENSCSSAHHRLDDHFGNERGK